jgi:hypothetical protein
MECISILRAFTAIRATCPLQHESKADTNTVHQLGDYLLGLTTGRAKLIIQNRDSRGSILEMLQPRNDK